MIKDSQSDTFNNRLRQSTLEADWRRVVAKLSIVDRMKFTGNPLIAINAVAEEFGCELSSVHLENSIDLRFIKRFGRNKMIWKTLIDRDLLSDAKGLTALLRITLPRQAAVATDKNTIREYFGPAASR